MSNNASKFETYCARTETLNEWINAIRYKKGIIRRQRKNPNLRVAAVLTTAIMRAEMDLKRKQTERAQRWAQVRAQYDENGSSSSSPAKDREMDGGHFESADDVLRREQEVAKLWSSELIGLDNLFNDLNQIKTVVAR